MANSVWPSKSVDRIVALTTATSSCSSSRSIAVISRRAAGGDFPYRVESDTQDEGSRAGGVIQEERDSEKITLPLSVTNRRTQHRPPQRSTQEPVTPLAQEVGVTRLVPKKHTPNGARIAAKSAIDSANAPCRNVCKHVCINANPYKSRYNKAWPQSSPHIFLATSVCISTKILGHVNVVRNGIGSRGGIKSY